MVSSAREMLPSLICRCRPLPNGRVRKSERECENMYKACGRGILFNSSLCMRKTVFRVYSTCLGVTHMEVAIDLVGVVVLFDIVTDDPSIYLTGIALISPSLSLQLTQLRPMKDSPLLRGHIEIY